MVIFRLLGQNGLKLDLRTFFRTQNTSATLKDATHFKMQPISILAICSPGHLFLLLEH